jgi:hypothetical protein
MSLKKVARSRRETFPPQAQHVAVKENSAASSSQNRRTRLASAAATPAPGGYLLRFQRFVSLLAASLIAFTPLQAVAQDADDTISVRDRARPEYDPLGVRLGGFTLNAALDLAVTSTDNLFAEEDAFADDDIIFSVMPTARLSSNWSRHALSLYGGAQSTAHEDFGSEDTDTYWFSGVGRLDIGRATTLTAAAGLAHEVEPRTDPDAPATPDPVEYDRNTLSLIAQHTFNRVRVTGEVSTASYEFDGAQSFRDSDESAVRGRVDIELTPRIGAMAQFTADERDSDNSPANSSEGQTVLVGATINFTDLMKGEITAGQFERDYDGLPDTDGLAVAGNLQWYITRLTTLTFDARRNAEDVVGGSTGLPYVESEYGGRVDHELLRNVLLTGALHGGQREYDVIDRDDEFLYGEAGADWLLNRRLVVRGRYEYYQTDSSGAAAYRDYEENRLSLGLSLRL